MRSKSESSRTVSISGTPSAQKRIHQRHDWESTEDEPGKKSQNLRFYSYSFDFLSFQIGEIHMKTLIKSTKIMKNQILEMFNNNTEVF